MNEKYDIIIVGGGAAGYFSAINIAANNPRLKLLILERGKEVLTKVKVSGGGRCNVTHAEFIPDELSKNYPRGEKELLGPFHKFMTGDTISWFEERGVPLKIEEDGRMFPTSNSSQTIIDCFVAEAEKYRIEIIKGEAVKNIYKGDNEWIIKSTKRELKTPIVIVASGSNTKVWEMMNKLGHTIIDPVPSLFTFNIKDSRIENLPGLSTMAKVEVISSENKVLLSSEGPLLITHWGMSGPAILKLSAWGARILSPLDYKFKIRINWLEFKTQTEVLNDLKILKGINPKQTIMKYAQFDLPKRLWQNLTLSSGIEADDIWADITKTKLKNLSEHLTRSIFQVNGKSTFKEEFVTAGGIDLKEVNFKTFESKLHDNLYFVGEVLNIDAITGGFNFQNAWTSGYLAALSITKTDE